MSFKHNVSYEIIFESIKETNTTKKCKQTTMY